MSGYVLKISRNLYVMLAAITGIAVGFVEAILPDPSIMLDPTIKSAIAVALPQLGTVIAAYFTAEASQNGTTPQTPP